MSEIWDVEMGYVTNRRGARIHLVVAGSRAYCQSGSGVIIRSRKARDTDGTNVCKKCRAALHTRLVDVLNVRERRAMRDLRGVSGNRSIITACEDLLDQLMAPVERADRDQMMAGIRHNLRASHESAIAMATPSESDDKLTLF